MVADSVPREPGVTSHEPIGPDTVVRPAGPSRGDRDRHRHERADIQLANLDPQMGGLGKWGALGVHYEPQSWYILRDASLALSGMQQLALYPLK